MTKQRITLVQTIGNLEDFYELRENNAIPLVLKLYKAEIEALEITSQDHYPSSISVPYLYTGTAKYNKKQRYVALFGHSLQKLIENHSIYIPEFIDMDAKRQYIDYIIQTYRSAFEDEEDANILCTDYQHRILFRDKKRLFERLGKNTDFVRGQFNENPNTKCLSDLLQETLDNTEKIEQNKEKIKSLILK